MIATSDLTVRYGDVTVLDGVDLSVSDGEFVGLVGPNGAGKTTLLRTLSGTLDPDGGHVTVDGRDVHALGSREASRLVSVVPQETNLSFSFTVRAVVEMGRTPHRSRFEMASAEDRERVEESLERTRTARFADRPIDEVSGGQRQRVFLARALAQDTPVMLLDEPTASLDVNHAVETLELVSDLVDAGKTVVAAIHDLDLAARYCDRLVVLADGSVLRQGPVEDVLTAGVVTEAFDTAAAVATNPVTGTPTVTALSSSQSDRLPERVHVLGRGRTAGRVLGRLAGSGVAVSVGPCSRTDVAAETARSLDAERLTVEPYGGLTEPDFERLATTVEAADAVVVADEAAGRADGRIPDLLTRHESVVVVQSDGAEALPAEDRTTRRFEELRADAVETAADAVVDAVATAATTPQSSETVESSEE